MIQRFLIFQLFALSVSNCNIQKNNPCDLNSKSYKDSLFAKAAIGDNSPHCGFSFSTTINYPSSSYTFTQGLPVSSATPTLSGAITSCASSPTLPPGLSIENATCAISGTPATVQSMANYAIIATNITGTGSTNISITIAPPAGTQYVLNVGGVAFNMRYVPGKTTFIGTLDQTQATVTTGYAMAETEVTYQLWSSVYTWAIANGYTFANAGVQGGNATACPGATTGTNQYPVTCVNWRDAIVWSNALTEFYNSQNVTPIRVVYTSDAGFTMPIRSSTPGVYTATVNSTAGSFDNPYVNPNAKGFRLPSDIEWELAARYIDDKNRDGDILDPGECYPGSYASGAAADYSNFAATSAVAWFGNSLTVGLGNATATNAVGIKAANALGLFDMSGNLYEYDWNPVFSGFRLVRGGNWFRQAYEVPIGAAALIWPPFTPEATISFRIARTPL